MRFRLRLTTTRIISGVSDFAGVIERTRRTKTANY